MRVFGIYFFAVCVCLSAPAQEVDLSKFEHLKQPRIAVQPNQKMLVVETKGDPNIVGGRAFGLLFQLYYSLPSAPKGPAAGVPRARWPQSMETPKAEWVGLYALPVPDTVKELPPFQPQPGLSAGLTNWEYGEVAEVLYIGPYSREQPALEKLRKFISDQGYTMAGVGHEEEYIAGPSPSGKGDPEKYATILRYRVRKIAQK